jgi:hypothetical protein
MVTVSGFSVRLLRRRTPEPDLHLFSVFSFFVIPFFSVIPFSPVIPAQAGIQLSPYGTLIPVHFSSGTFTQAQ